VDKRKRTSRVKPPTVGQLHAQQRLEQFFRDHSRKSYVLDEHGALKFTDRFCQSPSETDTSPWNHEWNWQPGRRVVGKAWPDDAPSVSGAGYFGTKFGRIASLPSLTAPNRRREAE